MSFEVDKNGRSLYHPRAFYIYVRAGVLDEQGALTPLGVPVFMHEYAHLIQDRCSLFGVVDFVHFIDTVQCLVGMLQSSSRPIVLPMKSHPAAAKVWLSKIEALRHIADPHGNWKNGVNWAYVLHTVKEEFTEYLDARRGFPLAIGTFVDNASEDTYEHEIGPREITEAYSTAVQVLHGGQVVDHPDEFQYLAVERILAHSGIVDERQRLTICHWALQDRFPGVRFFRLLTKLEELVQIPPAEALYDLCRSWAREDGYEDQIGLVDAQLSLNVNNQAASGENDPYYQALSWYHGTAMSSLRLNVCTGRRFPLDTYLGTPHGVGAGTLSELLKEQPIPLVETSEAGSFSRGADPQDSANVLFVKCFVAAFEQLWHFGETTWECPIFRACDAKHIPFKDKECLVRPWRKGARLPLCPYGAVAAYLRIADVKFAAQ